MTAYSTLCSARPTGCRWSATVALIVLLCSGCATDSKSGKLASWDVRKAIGWRKETEKPEPKVPDRLVATWTETVLNKAGETPKRGFGGRIAFFTRESDDPVRVDGQLVVYAFDETSRAAHETQPTRKYVFPAEEVVRHESDSALGPSYSFWLPWDEVGGPQRNISLIARFEPRGGAIVIGEQTKHFLPGTKLDPLTPQLALPSPTDVMNGVRLANYSQLGGESKVPDLAEPPANQGADESGIGKPKLMSTETIELPARLANAIKASPRLQSSGMLGAETAADVPLSRFSTMRPSGPLGPSEQTTTSMPPSTGPAAATSQPPQPKSRPIAAGGPAAPGSLRGSLLGTLPARARQAERPAPGRAR